MGKIKLNKDGLKGIFINHVEKMVLGVVLLVFGVFVYSSLGLEGLSGDQTPNKLIQSAQSAEKNINNPENAKTVLASVTVSSGYVERAKNRLIPTNSQLYAGTRPITPSYLQEGSKRPDPTLLPPEKVEVVAVTGPVAFFMKNPEEDELAKKDNAAPPKAEAPKKKKTNKSSAESFGYGYGGADSAESMSGMSSASGSSGMPGMMPGMPGMMPGMPGSEGTGATTGGTLANVAERPGFVAVQGSFPMIAKSRSCVAVKAIVPWKRQWEEFESKFSTALGYNPTRDTPRYNSFTVERLEVSDDPAAPLDWTKAEKIAWRTKIYKEVSEAGYGGFAQEIADPRYLQFGVLTFPVPPFINRNLEPLALHTDVPKMTPNSMAPVTGKEGDKDGKKKKSDKKTKTEETDESGFAQATAPGAVGADGVPTTGMPGMPGSMGMAGMGMTGGMSSSMPGMPGMTGGMPGMTGGMPGMPGMGMGGMGGDVSGMTSSMSGSSGMESMGMGMGMSGGYGYGSDPTGGMMGGMGAGMPRGPAVPYLLVRFFDFSVEPGKTYRYRVQVFLEDPNHPQVPQLDPSDRYLDDSVKKRLSEVAVEEKTMKEKNPQSARKYWLKTEFSQPSEPVKVEVRPWSYAGQVEPAKVAMSPERTQDKVLVDEPQAKVMSVVWDAVHATEVSGISEVMRGSYLNFNSDGNAIHPVSLLFKSLKKYDFLTERLIADIRGGEELAGKEKEQPLLAPGQYALVDDKGQLIVRNEFDDWDSYRRYTLPEAPEPLAGMTGMGGEEAGGKMPGPGMMPGMPGPPGMKKKK